MLRVKLHRQARKQLLKLPRSVQRRVIGALDELSRQKHPLKHRHVVKLTGRTGSDYRLRVGDYRIKFTLLHSHDVMVTRIEHRQVGY